MTHVPHKPQPIIYDAYDMTHVLKLFGVFTHYYSRRPNYSASEKRPRTSSRGAPTIQLVKRPRTSPLSHDKLISLQLLTSARSRKAEHVNTSLLSAPVARCNYFFLLGLHSRVRGLLCFFFFFELQKFSLELLNTHVLKCEICCRSAQ